MTRWMTVFQSTHSMRSATICRSDAIVRSDPEVIRSQHERRCRKTGKSLFFSSSRLNKIFILFNLVYRLKSLSFLRVSVAPW